MDVGYEFEGGGEGGGEEMEEVEDGRRVGGEGGASVQVRQFVVKGGAREIEW